MIFDVPYACPVDVIPMRARNVVRQYVRRVLPVDVPEHPNGHLRIAAYVNDKEKNRQFAIMRDTAGQFYLQSFLIADPLPEGILTELPPVRRLAKDYQEETEAEIANRASRMIYMNGSLHRPIPEPYFSVQVDYYGARTVLHTNGLEYPGYYPTFRMDEQDRAEAHLTDWVNRMDHRPRDHKIHLTKVTVQDDVVCRHDQEPSAIVFAATRLLTIVQNVVGKLPTKQIMSWVALRDLTRLQTETGRIDLDVLSQQLVMTYEDLANTPALKRYQAGRVVKQVVDDYARPRMALGLRDLSFPG